MTTVIQRVKEASVEIDGKLYSSTGRGFLVLFGVRDDDKDEMTEFMADKLAKLRIFEDDNGKMNLSPIQLIEKGEECDIMVVSQFTLLADCKGQNRPSFIRAARPEKAIPMYEKYVDILRTKYGFHVETGVFGADMQIRLQNDGPVTIILDTDKL